MLKRYNFRALLNQNWKRQNHFQNMGYMFSLIAIMLYVFSPNDPSTGLPSAYASRYMWTPLIPISIGLSVALFSASGILGRSSTKETIFSILLIFVLVLLSPQFAEFSPLGVDGWWFVEIGERYATYSNNRVS